MRSPRTASSSAGKPASTRTSGRPIASRAAVLTAAYASSGRMPRLGGEQVGGLQGVAAADRVRRRRATRRCRRRRRTPAARSSAYGRCSLTDPSCRSRPAAGRSPSTPAAASWSAARAAASRRSRDEAAARADRHAGAQAAGHRRQPGQPGRVGAVGVQVDRAAVLGGELQHGLRVAGRVRRPDRGSRPPPRRPSSPRRAAWRARRRRPRRSAAAARRPRSSSVRPRSERRAWSTASSGSSPLTSSIRTCERSAVAPCPSWSRAASVARRWTSSTAYEAGPCRAEGGQRGVAVGVRLGGGGQQQVAVEVDAGAVRGEAAGGAHRLDAAAAEPYVHGAAVGEPGAAEEQAVGRRRARGRGWLSGIALP